MVSIGFPSFSSIFPCFPLVFVGFPRFSSVFHAFSLCFHWQVQLARRCIQALGLGFVCVFGVTFASGVMRCSTHRTPDPGATLACNAVASASPAGKEMHSGVGFGFGACFGMNVVSGVVRFGHAAASSGSQQAGGSWHASLWRCHKWVTASTGSQQGAM